MTIAHEWVEYGLVLITACIAVANAALRQGQRDQTRQLERSNQVADLERSAYWRNRDFQQQLITNYQVMLEEREARIQELTNRLDALKYLCDN